MGIATRAAKGRSSYLRIRGTMDYRHEVQLEQPPRLGYVLSESTLFSIVLIYPGYSYDYLGPDNLASSDAFVNEGKLGIPEYKAVIFNN